MPAAEISVIVESNTEDSVSVQGFLDAVSHTLEILRNLDTAISLRRAGTLRWVISDLRSESPATATLRAVPSSEEQDFSYDVIRSYLDGLEQLSTGNALPDNFPDDALESAKRERSGTTSALKSIFPHLPAASAATGDSRRTLRPGDPGRVLSPRGSLPYSPCPPSREYHQADIPPCRGTSSSRRDEDRAERFLRRMHPPYPDAHSGKPKYSRALSGAHTSHPDSLRQRDSPI